MSNVRRCAASITGEAYLYNNFDRIDASSSPRQRVCELAGLYGTAVVSSDGIRNPSVPFLLLLLSLL